VRGRIGEAGEQGPQGEQGLGGPPGAPGAQGPPGSQGAYGKEGVIGGIGDTGPSGIKGYPGPRGRTGDRGVNGPRGPTGPPGPPGPTSNPFDPAVLAKLLSQYPDPEKGLTGPSDYHHQTYYRAIKEKTKDKNVLNMFDLLDALEAKVDTVRKPDGSRSFPSTSCRDIQMCIPESKSGDYWLDPNGGDTSDAFKVHCDFEKIATCIKPSAVFDLKEFSAKKNEKYNWMSTESATIEYSPSVSQLKTLRLSHRFVKQNVTYLCKNAPAHIKLLSNNNRELHKMAGKSDRLNVVKDECTIKDGEWRSAVVEFSSADLNKLPIRDIAVAGTDGEGYFTLKTGSVCFY
jgi:hypothetical protein